MKGTLYLVSTPIGNLGDLTFRAVETLKSVDIIAAEDTRQSIKLLNHFEISKPLVSYYEHNKIEKGNYLIQQLQEGKSIALVSDAGTPGISDPGEDLVRLAIQNDIAVTAIPGAVAAITGLIISGLPTGRFVFEGFLPMNKRSRAERLESLKDEIRTIIFYEAPHKLKYTLEDILKYLGNKKIVMARELTKKFEEVIRCNVSEALEMFADENPRGEFVLIVEGADKLELEKEKQSKWKQMTIQEHVGLYLSQGLSRKEAIKKAAEDRGIPKRDVYNSLLE